MVHGKSNGKKTEDEMEKGIIYRIINVSRHNPENQWTWAPYQGIYLKDYTEHISMHTQNPNSKPQMLDAKPSGYVSLYTSM